MARLLLLNGPNLNLLGRREPGLYGATTLGEIEGGLRKQAAEAGHELDTFQSDAEHELIHRIHQARDQQVRMILFNPAAFTHTSVALRDALLAVQIPFVELHLSNVAAREPFRHRSFFSDVAVGTITGFGVASYELALSAALRYLAREGEVMDIRKVKKLIELLEESGISEIEISEGEESVRISRYPHTGPITYSAPLPAMHAPAAPAPAAEAAPAPAAAPSRGQQVTAPMVGTFYSSPAPGAKPFVEIGTEVKPGDTLCVIEAMKMMNQIESEVAGRVVSILVENGNPVEFGQALFIIE